MHQIWNILGSLEICGTLLDGIVVKQTFKSVVFCGLTLFAQFSFCGVNRSGRVIFLESGLNSVLHLCAYVLGNTEVV